MGHHKDHHAHHHHCHHPHSHQHGGEEHVHEEQAAPTERDKLRRMLEHWLHHNEEHAASYGNWAARARAMEEMEVCELLEEMAREARRQNEKLEVLLAKVGK